MAIDFLIDRFRAVPNQPAILSPAGSCTFGELVGLIDHTMLRLRDLDLAPFAVVEVRGDYSPKSIALLLSLARHGAIIVPEWSQHGRGREQREQIASVEAVFTIDGNDQVHFDRTGRKAEHPLYSELRQRRNPGLVQFTSGTTGAPKAAVHDLTKLLTKYRVPRPALRTLAFLLFDHLGGINTMLHTLANGAALVSTADRSPNHVCRLVETHRVELLPATPTFFNLLLLSGAIHRFDLSRLRAITYGAEPMPAVTLERLKQAFPNARLQQTYGMVEVGALRTKSRHDGSLWMKVGGEGIETRIVNGILEIRSPSMLLGYLNAPSPISEDGWLVTGDRAEEDGDYLLIQGRDSDLINVGGEKVYPIEVEGVIESMDGVLAATVYGRPNPLTGEIVCARVMTSGNIAAHRLKTLVRMHCSQRLESYKVPVKVEMATDLDRGVAIKKSRKDT